MALILAVWSSNVKVKILYIAATIKPSNSQVKDLFATIDAGCNEPMNKPARYRKMAIILQTEVHNITIPNRQEPDEGALACLTLG